MLIKSLPHAEGSADFAARVSDWTQGHQKRAQADPAFLDTVPGRHPCVGTCRGIMHLAGGAAVDELLLYIRRVLRFFTKHTKRDGHDPTTDHIVYFLVAHAQQTTSALLEAELFRMEPALAHLDGEATLPLLLGVLPRASRLWHARARCPG